ncbi:hypothetical protein CRYUN_Cryun19dG0019600 [Craigia yunnanensis]
MEFEPENASQNSDKSESKFDDTLNEVKESSLKIFQQPESIATSRLKRHIQKSVCLVISGSSLLKEVHIGIPNTRVSEGTLSLSSSRYDDAWKVYEAMEANNVQPDYVTYSLIITIMRKTGRSAKDAWEFFERMNRKRVKWSAEVLGAIIKSFSDEGLKKPLLSNQKWRRKGFHQIPCRRMQPEIVKKLLLDMQDMGLKPNAKSYTCLISAYGRQKKMCDRAADAFLRMKKVGLKPTSHSYTSLIHAYSISGWHEKAYIAFEDMSVCRSKDVISEFGKIGLQPIVMTYNMLMNAYARGGLHQNLPQLLKDMAALNLKPDSVTYSTMIYAFVRVRDFMRAFYYHKQMVKSGQVPDVKSYEKLRAILDVKAAKQNKRDRSAILGIINSKMGMVKTKRKTNKDEFWKYKTKHHKTPDVAYGDQQ